MDCSLKGKWFVGCHFEPRYDYGSPDLSTLGGYSGSRAAELIEASKPKTYVKDVCVACGREILRK